MPLAMNVNQVITEGNTSINISQNYVPDLVAKLEETVADSTTDAQYLLALDISTLLVFAMTASVAMTVKTNSSGSPQETFALSAGGLILFRSGDTAIFSGDVTSIFVTNASGGAGTLKILAGLAT